MHCLLIVSRKDQTNKKKLSPLTNHKDTKKGTVMGDFDRVNLFQQAKQGFDNLFSYNRQQIESFDYHNIMKNISIFQQIELQELDIQNSEGKIEINLDCNQENKLSISLSFPRKHEQISSSSLTILSSGANHSSELKEKTLKEKKKRSKKPKM